MIRGEEFLKLAEAYATGTSEADWRSAVSRAYYAAFHVARDFMTSLGFVTPRAEAAHAFLWRRLGNCGLAPLALAGSRLNQLRGERNRADYDLNSDYLEIVIQYGYVTMFVVAFPLAPALALLNNIFESKVDLFKLTECRRPALQQRSNIGSWHYCMEFISFLSVITNCYLIVNVSTHFELIVPDDLEPYVRSESGR
jgi:uncharacterized protein (UPF0332 family)